MWSTYINLNDLMRGPGTWLIIWNASSWKKSSSQHLSQYILTHKLTAVFLPKKKLLVRFAYTACHCLAYEIFFCVLNFLLCITKPVFFSLVILHNVNFRLLSQLCSTGDELLLTCRLVKKTKPNSDRTIRCFIFACSCWCIRAISVNGTAGLTNRPYRVR